MAEVDNNSKNITMLQEELICPICLDLFERPISLPCLHSFCFKCIQQKTARDATQQVFPRGYVICTCPTCRKRNMIPNVENLPKNFSLANIVEKFKQVMELKKVMCTFHNQDVGLFCEDCLSLMCFTCFGDHKGHKIDDVKKVCERYKSKMELTLLPGLHMKQRQLGGAVEHWNGIMQTEQAGRLERNEHISKELKLMKNMLNEYLMDRISGMSAYNCKMTNQLIKHCENKKKIVEKDLINVNKLISDIISDTDPARTLLTFTEITKRGDHDIEKLSDYAMDLPKKAIHMKLDPIWRKKLEEFSNSVKMTMSGVEEDGLELPVEILDEKKIFSLNNLPYSIKITEMEEQIKALIPLNNVTSLDCMFDKQKVMVHFSTLNKEFLTLHKDATPETVFGWEIKLQREIQPVKSSSKVIEEGIEINLIKAKKEQWEILQRAASPIISESSELASKDSTSVKNTPQSSQPSTSIGSYSAPCTTNSTDISLSPKPSTSYGSCVTSSSKKRPSLDGNEYPSNCRSGRKKRKSLQHTDEQVADLLKEMVDKKEIEHFISSKILMAYPEYDVSNKTELIKETLQKLWT